MKKILLIGDYFPNLSWDSFWNNVLAEALVDAGYQVTLLSKSWCEVEENNFIGNVNELTSPGPFTCRYYIDPFQMKRTNGDLLNGFLGLACQIIPFEKIDCLLFSEHIQHSLLVELIKNRFNIPCYLSLFSLSTISRYLHDDYALGYIRQTLTNFEKIFTFDSYSEGLSRSVLKKNIFSALPFKLCQNENFSFDNQKMNITGILQNFAEWEILSKQAVDYFSSKQKDYFLAGNNITELEQTIHLQKKDRLYKIVKLSDLSQMSNIAPVLFVDEVFGQMDLIKCFTAMKYGFSPIINDNNLHLLQKFSGIKSKPFIPGFSHLINLNIPGSQLVEMI